MKSKKRIGIALLAVLVVGVSVLAGTVHAATKSGSTIVIWTDSYRVAAFKSIGAKYTKAHPGVTIQVVQKQFGVSGAGTIGGDLATTSSANAPDVISTASDWVGQLSANGLIVPIRLTTAQKALFPKYTLDGGSYGTTIKNLYSVPTQVENVGLVVNTKLAPVPTTWAMLESKAMAFKKAHHLAVGIAVPDGQPNGDAYHMYPFLSGLGGYIFARNSAGLLQKCNVGVASPALLSHAGTINKWNAEGLISSSVDYGTAKDLFMKGKIPYWITGPWESSNLKDPKLNAAYGHFKIVQVPKIFKAAVPFLGLQGASITKYAAAHGNGAIAADFVGNYLTSTSAQLALAKAEGRAPASIPAGKLVNDPVLAQFGKASVGGVPMPNIPEMNSVWQYLGQAWVLSTKGAGATPAKSAFSTAQQRIKNAIGC
jgi:arabinogalactan oligomer / maltooligosaccharide transport system substrate-binding protein